MKIKLKQKIEHLLINDTSNLTAALKQMDTVDKKLLIVLNDKQEYKNIISVGDIQRDLIKNQNFNAKITTVLRKKIRVANKGQSLNSIKKEMLDFRMELMPVLDENNDLINVIFWDELFEEKHKQSKVKLNIPLVIMAGGKGERLKPITNVIPKPLIPIGSKTILEHIIERFQNCGIEDIFLTVNYKSKMIKNHFKEIKNKPYTITYLNEEKPSGTAGSLSLLKNRIKKTFFVSNCDILINQEYQEIYDYHRQNSNELTLVGAIKNISMPYGILKIKENGLLQEISEKPELNHIVNAGLYLIEPHLLEEIPENDFFHITHLIQNIINRNGRVGVFPVSEASWMDIGNWTEYNETLKKLGETPFV